MIATDPFHDSGAGARRRLRRMRAFLAERAIPGVPTNGRKDRPSEQPEAKRERTARAYRRKAQRLGLHPRPYAPQPSRNGQHPPASAVMVAPASTEPTAPKLSRWAQRDPWWGSDDPLAGAPFDLRH